MSWYISSPLFRSEPAASRHAFAFADRSEAETGFESPKLYSSSPAKIVSATPSNHCENDERWYICVASNQMSRRRVMASLSPLYEQTRALVRTIAKAFGKPNQSYCG